jgi:hypothetical protein
VDSLDEFRRVHSKEDEKGGDKQGVVQIKWKNPPICMIKIIWDIVVGKNNEGFVYALTL